MQADIEKAKLKCPVLPYETVYSFAKDRIITADHEFSYEEIEERFVGPMTSILTLEVEDVFDGMEAGEFKKFITSTGENFPGIQTVLAHEFIIWEGVEDGVVNGYKRVSEHDLYIDYSCNFPHCVLVFTIPLSEYLNNKQVIDQIYQEIEVQDEEVSFSLNSVRLYFDLQFYYALETGDIGGLNMVLTNIEW